ncbi:MAG: GH116 family glycosyl hydrolase [Gemmatimonadaceae bacterium]
MPRRFHTTAIAIAATLVAFSHTLLAQERPGTVRWFDLGQSPIALSGDVRPGMYLAAPGRRSIAMGTEDGRLELWSWPIKWLHDLQLSFRVPKYSAPLNGRDVARHVVVRPEGFTIEYSYETFTVKEHVFTPLNLPATIILLEVDAIRPMEIIASFTPDIHFAWPASLGGQYVAWSNEDKAFIFSESRRKVNAFLGSPAVTQASDVPAHMLAAAPPQFVIGVGSSDERYTEPRLGEPPGKNVNVHTAYIPIVLAGGEMSRDSVRALYAALSAPRAAEREWLQRVAHADSLRTQTVAVVSPDERLNRAVEWAKVNLDDAMVCNPDLGCGLVAGYGLSGGASDRPGFGWFFGGDASINSFAMSAVGQHDLVRDGAFRFFAKYQRADGKITHEISQGAGKIDWFGAYPYAFYHGDTTPFWILAFGEYWRQSADTALVRELWPNVRKAFDWSKRADSDGDGLMENTLAGAGALELGDLQAGIVSDVYLSGVWIASLERFARMAEAMREPALAAEARTIRGKALRTLEQKLWLPDARQYAFAILERGAVNDNLTAWPATAMSFDVFDRTHGAEMAARLASSNIMTDWGARPLSATSKLFDPLHYNNGAVWPFVTGWVSLAAYRYHHAAAGRFALDAIVRTGFDESLGRNPEVLSGRLYKPLDTAVPHQFFATSMVLTPLLRGLVGLDVDAPAGRVTVAPHLPPEWDSLRVDHVRVGQEVVSLRLTRKDRSLALEVWREQGSGARPIDIEFAPALPLGADSIALSSAASGPTETLPGAVIPHVSGRLRERLRLIVTWSGGWELRPPPAKPQIGDRSAALRVISERYDQGRYVVQLEGLAGAHYELGVRGPAATRMSVDVQPSTVAMPPLVPHPPDARGFASLGITFPTADPNADGYVPLTLVFARQRD